MKLDIKLLLALLLFVTACSDDFLDADPDRYLSSDRADELLKTNPDKITEGYLLGMYYDLFKYRDSHDDFGLRAMMLATDMMTDDIAYNITQWFNFDYQLDNRGAPYRRPRSAWRTMYDGIRGANTVIGLIKPQDGEELENAVSRNAIGQAYTARAYFYFWLINMYQHPYQWNKDAPGVPIITEDEMKLARQPVRDVYDLILSDIDKGYNYLKGTNSASGRLNQYAAAAIYAKVLSFVNDYPNQWQEVVKYADIAIDGVPLMTADELAGFGFNTVSGNKNEVLWGALISTETNTFYASFMSHIDADAGGYGGALGQYKEPTSELVEALAAQEGDVRQMWFEERLINGEEEDENGDPIKVSRDPKLYVNKKFRDVGGFESDYIYLRVAEMHYLKAEALYLDGHEGDAKAALETIMQARMAGYTCTKSGEELMAEIDLQKRIDMWGEGTRLFDLKRRNEAIDRTGSENHRPNVIMNVLANDKLLIYRIPQVEIDANDEIGQEDQNP